MSVKKACPECGQQADIMTQYCGKCGYQFYRNGDEQSIPLPNKHFKGYLLADIDTYIGKQSDFYMEQFKELRRKNLTFNFCMALFGIDWMCYRKMWRYAGIYAVIHFACLLVTGIGLSIWVRMINPADLTVDFLTSALHWITAIGWVLRLVLFFVNGLIGDFLYWRSVKRALDKQDCFNRAPVYDKELEKTLAEQGGTLSVGETVGVVFLTSLCSWALVQAYSGFLVSSLLPYFAQIGI